MNKDEYIVCEACGVKIKNDLAYYSVGKPSDLDYLSQRVCQYRKVNKPCANIKFDPDKQYPAGYEDITW